MLGLEMLENLINDKNFFLLTEPDNILSVFDHTSYDRSDLDILSPPQRQYVEKKLKTYGYKFKTGRILMSDKSEALFIIPKQSIISANPYDIIRKEKRSDKDFFVLTPTQSACYIINNYFDQDLEIKLKKLIDKQPINLKKIYDHSRFEKSKESFFSIFKTLEAYQEDVLENSNLKFKSHIGKFF